MIGINIDEVLIDKGVYPVDRTKMLDRLKVEFLIPAIKNERLKRATEDYHNSLILEMVKFKIGNSREGEEASFDLMIYRKDAKETDPISDQYTVFAKNMKYSEAMKLYRKIPLDYNK
jgi:hypothetical protein